MTPDSAARREFRFDYPDITTAVKTIIGQA